MKAAAGQLCPDEVLRELAEKFAGGDSSQAEVSGFLKEYPDDPRLHFLLGSLLASAHDYEAARRAMRHSVDLAPDFHVARFQLGFLLLTSGEAVAAQEAWGPLHGLPSRSYLRCFVDGLCHLVRDEFDAAVQRLEEGISANRENVAMNRDMELIIGELRSKRLTGDGETASSVDLLLRQAAMKSTQH